MGEHSEREALKFNIGIGYVMRIDYILANIMKAREDRNAEMWYLHLQSLYMEIKAKMKTEEQKTADQLMGRLTDAYNSWCDTPTRYQSGALSDVYAESEALEGFLREILHNLGLLTPTKDAFGAHFG